MLYKPKDPWETQLSKGPPYLQGPSLVKILLETSQQKRLIRVVTCSKYNAHTDPLLKNIQILKLQDLLDLNALKFYYRYQHGNLPSFFYSFSIFTQGAHHSHDTYQRDICSTR